MSKSLHNFITVHDIIKQVDPQVLRFFMATTQYRRPIQYSEDNLKDAKNNLDHIQTAYNNLEYRKQDAQDGNDADVDDKLAEFKDDFIQAMDDDINVQNGIAVVYELVKFANLYSEKNEVHDKSIDAIQNLLKQLMSIFGVKLTATGQIDDDDIKKLIDQRDEARKNKDFALSDKIRDDLKAKGIILEDTPQGTRYRKE